MIEVELERLIESRVREYRNRVYRKYFDLPEGSTIVSGIQIREINGHRYLYICYRLDGRQKSLYLGKPDSYRVQLAKKLEEKVSEYRRELVSRLIEFLKLYREGRRT